MQSILSLMADNQLLLAVRHHRPRLSAGQYQNCRISAWESWPYCSRGFFSERSITGLGLPEYIYVIGLVLFVYAIGLQSGPGFFASFRRRGLRINGVVVLILAVGRILAVFLGKFAGFPARPSPGFSAAL